jgi:hypothetical protein
MYREMNKYISGGLLVILAAGIIASYTMYLKPQGKQEQATLGLVIATAVFTGIIGFLFAYVGLKGNITVQLQFFIPLLILVLLPTCIISATVSANQLYGLREAVAAGKQT